MNIIDRDILTVETGVIAHQANTQGLMGAGLAKAIKAKYTNVFHEYAAACRRKEFNLGDMLPVKVNDNLYVANIAGQSCIAYGNENTEYDALEQGLWKAVQFAAEKDLTLYLPYRIGAGLGGGDWDKVCDIINRVAPEAVICKLPR